MVGRDVQRLEVESVGLDLRALVDDEPELAEDASDELVCRWVNVALRAVPPEADTIIRTITKTTNGNSSSSTHWLEGLQPPLCAR